jgi:hypothetical protein
MRLPFIVLLVLLCCGIVSAADLPSVQEELYGTIVYNDTTPVPAGATIVVTNQSGHVVGTHVVEKPGAYGASIVNGDRLHVDAVLGDWLYVTVDGIPVDGHRIIVPGGVSQYNIVVPISPAPIVPVPTPDSQTTEVPADPTPAVSFDPTPDVTATAPPVVVLQSGYLNLDSVTVPGLNIAIPFTSGVVLVCLGAFIIVFLIVTTIYLICYRKTKDTETLNF